MKLLNEFYNKSCKLKYESYKQISSHITLIDNFFENFKSAKNFFINRDKWECISYQNHFKPGYESIFPDWVGRSLMEKFILDNNIIDDINSYVTVCNFFYNQYLLWSLSNSSYYPHIDSTPDDDAVEYVCLINLNDIPISTNFYTYKNQECSSIEMRKDFCKYNKDISKELLDYYGKENITNEEVKIFLDKKQDLKVKLHREVEYKSNQAIVYPSNVFHSPNITQEFTKDNPRSALRITFWRKV